MYNTRVSMYKSRVGLTSEWTTICKKNNNKLKIKKTLKCNNLASSYSIGYFQCESFGSMSPIFNLLIFFLKIKFLSFKAF